MILPKTPPSQNLLFLGTEFFSMDLPKELDVSLKCLPWNRETGMTNQGHISKVIPYHEIDGVLIIPQPTVKEICNSEWLDDLSKKLPVALIWYDYLIYKDWVEKLKNCLHVVLDDQRVNGHNLMPLWTPFQLEKRAPQEERKIEVGFFGKVDCHQRKDALNFLLNKGMSIFTTGNEWNFIDIRMMYHYMRNCKIIINFPNTRFHPIQHTQQLKGRVLEAMQSGAMIIENTNNQSNVYFIPGKDLIWFDNNEDLYNKLNFYLKNDNERIKIANNGHQLCKDKYNIENWWQKLIPRLLKFKTKKLTFM